MGVNSLPKTVTRQRRGCDLNPGRTLWITLRLLTQWPDRAAPESSTLTTRLPIHPATGYSVGLLNPYSLLNPLHCVHKDFGLEKEDISHGNTLSQTVDFSARRVAPLAASRL